MQKSSITDFKEQLQRFQEYLKDPGKGYMISTMAEKYFNEDEAYALEAVYYNKSLNSVVLQVDKLNPEASTIDLSLLISMLELSEMNRAKLYLNTGKDDEKIQYLYVKATKNRKTGVLFLKLKNGETKQIFFKI